MVSVWVRPLPLSCPSPALTPAETIQHPTLKITVVTNEASQEKLCETSQDRQDLVAYWARENGELIIGDDWLTESDITDAEQLEVTAAPGVLRLQRQEVDVFRV
ncbi:MULTISPECIES: hypothetical protein [Serratia]|uniref:hypothetical protein n=1 Tax=Serratia TaxID=613 RepID=UPI00351C0D7C